MSRAIAPLLLALGVGLSSGCADDLGEGELGTPRMVGFVRGAPPAVRVLAPVADRAGNLYVLAGRKDLREVDVFVGRRGGGFSSGCRLTKGDTFGPHGWIGASLGSRSLTISGREQGRADRQWYWSGGALVAVSAFGDCRRVLDRDPGSGADLLFDAVLPWVNDTPSKTTAVALVRASAEALPFSVVVDLNANIYTDPRAFEPLGAQNLVVHGVGGSAESREGWVLLSFDEGGRRRSEARFFDATGAVTATAPIVGAADLGPYTIRGYLEEGAGGLVAGVTADARLVLFDRGGGKVVPVSGMDAVGVHAWHGALFLVGTSAVGPVLSAIDEAGNVAPPIVWRASQRIEAELGRGVAVTDDRAPPRRTTRFDQARAPGVFPLVTEHSSFPYVDGATLTLIAGPVVGQGESSVTLLAIAPVGVTYP